MPHYRDQIKRCVKIYDFNVLRRMLDGIDFTTTQGDVSVTMLSLGEAEDEQASTSSGDRAEPSTRRSRGQRKPSAEKRKEKLTIDDYKYIAFQFGQTIALLRGQDLYTKTSVAQALPSLGPFLRRERETILGSLYVLNEVRDELMRELRGIRVVALGELNLFALDADEDGGGEGDRNQLYNQSRGTVVDALRGRVVCFPLTLFANRG
jgi:hypothetical protein